MLCPIAYLVSRAVMGADLMLNLNFFFRGVFRFPLTVSYLVSKLSFAVFQLSFNVRVLTFTRCVCDLWFTRTGRSLVFS